MSNEPMTMSRRNILLASTAGVAVLAAKAAVGQQTAEQATSSPTSAFSFIAYGDSRAMMYLPSKEA